MYLVRLARTNFTYKNRLCNPQEVGTLHNDPFRAHSGGTVRSTQYTVHLNTGGPTTSVSDTAWQTISGQNVKQACSPAVRHSDLPIRPNPLTASRFFPMLWAVGLKHLSRRTSLLLCGSDIRSLPLQMMCQAAQTRDDQWLESDACSMQHET
ncbi:hypothetical protein BDU57DRAFT_133461 [Ampelomyces quisqualis]|uniref:Uncharacterized protein n=1 Tax=Ampelomyces quisqualis TaxID=50730 RepID=A0A6A5QZD6_AMPQU|nr:hypothetical protein BDU57DRAFT_133461 [Ampelomyces quisqualis]